MRIDDLHCLPKFRDSLSYLYLEHGNIDKHEQSIAFYDSNGITPVPASSLAVLMLGPGTRITHAAISTLADNNCLLIWCGEENVRFYACGTGGTRSSAPLLLQARLASDEVARLQVVKRMYQMRFLEDVDPSLTIEQLRGREGIRVRDSYAQASKKYGVVWSGRSYDRQDWRSGDPVNRALSAANSCLYGLCHAAILSAGYSPAIGFIHTGKQLSFVYDVADLYKADLTIPLAFQMAINPPNEMERQVRLRLRDIFRETKLVQRVIPDIKLALGDEISDENSLLDGDPAMPTELWTPETESRQSCDLEN